MPTKTHLTLHDMDTWIRLLARLFEQNLARLSQFDAALGDGDHGASMVRAMRAIVAKLDASPPADIGALLRTTGMTLLSAAGGATGPLFGTIFLEAAKPAGGKMQVGLDDVAAMAAAACAGVMARGGATTGEKTMVDALAPAAAALQQAAAAGRDLPTALAEAAAASGAGARATAAMLAARGRARYLGERSLGHEDAGAHSVALIFSALAQVMG